MQEYVQKSTTTTLPRRATASSGGEFNQAVAPARDGKSPSTGSAFAVSACDATGVPAMELLIAMVLAVGFTPSISVCSNLLVLVVDRRASTVVSHPKAMATTPS